MRKSIIQTGNASPTASGLPALPGGEAIMERRACQFCGYLYDPEVGDSLGGIPPGTWFEELPEDWVCPECGATPDQFVLER